MGPGGSLAHLRLNFPENIKTFLGKGFLCLPILPPNSDMGAAPKRLLAVAYITTCGSVKRPDQERVKLPGTNVLQFSSFNVINKG